MAFLLASIATIGWLCGRCSRGQAILPFAARQPVPWTFVAPALMLGTTLLGVVASLFSDSAPGPSASQLDPGLLWAWAGWNVFAAAMACLLIAAVFQADARDLGWPESWQQLRRDVGAGVVGFVAVLAPVYLIQWMLVTLVEPDTVHPLLEQFAKTPTWEMALAAGAMAVVGAPVFEETAFRLVFQGWLERFGQVRRQELFAAEPTIPETMAEAVAEPTSDAHVAAVLDEWGAEGRVEKDAFSVAPGEPSTLDATPTRWTPIVISAALFSFVHLGQNVAPISLLPLGFVLGYLYQRTHRLAAPITCHAAFNAYAVVALWLNPDALAK